MPAMLKPYKCADCGTTFHARRENATYCSPTCRRRASRARGGAEVEAPQPTTIPRAVPEGAESPAESQPVPDPPLVASVIEELRKADKLETRRGQQAVVLARKLASSATTASAAASVSKALDEMMDSLVAQQGGSGAAPAGRRGTLAQRRQQKRGAA